MDCSAKTEAGWRLERRNRIVSAAAELFRTRPFQAVQMDEVAARAGMGKATVYRYFPSKEALFLAIASDALERLDERLAAAAAAADTGPIDRLRAMLVTLVDVFAGQISSLRLLTAEQVAMETRWRHLYREHRGRIVERLRETLVAGMAAGQFRRLDVDAVPALMIGMIRGGLMAAPQVEPERLADSVCAIALWGCLGRPEGEPVKGLGEQ